MISGWEMKGSMTLDGMLGMICWMAFAINLGLRLLIERFTHRLADFQTWGACRHVEHDDVAGVDPMRGF